MLSQYCSPALRLWCEATLSRVLLTKWVSFFAAVRLSHLANEWLSGGGPKFVCDYHSRGLRPRPTHTPTYSVPALAHTLSLSPPLSLLTIPLFVIPIRIRILSSHFCFYLRLLHPRFCPHLQDPDNTRTSPKSVQALRKQITAN